MGNELRKVQELKPKKVEIELEVNGSNLIWMHNLLAQHVHVVKTDSSALERVGL